MMTMAKTDLTIDVHAKLSVDRKTADTCLRLVELFCNENGLNLIGHHSNTGELTLKFERRREPKISAETMAAIHAIGLDSHSKGV